jgi:hypothetical protein
MLLSVPGMQACATTLPMFPLELHRFVVKHERRRHGVFLLMGHEAQKLLKLNGLAM